LILAKKINKEKISKILVPIHGKELVDNIVSDFSNPKNVFTNYNFPSCFHCEKCEVTEECLYFMVIRHIKMLQNIQKENLTNQENIKNVIM